MAGQKILNGEFDLTRISFPIRCMSKDTALIKVAQHFSTVPLYYGKAARLGSEPIERIKMVVCAEVSKYCYNISFEKPLNPILGETYIAKGQDGS